MAPSFAKRSPECCAVPSCLCALSICPYPLCSVTQVRMLCLKLVEPKSTLAIIEKLHYMYWRAGAHIIVRSLHDKQLSLPHALAHISDL